MLAFHHWQDSWDDKILRKNDLLWLTFWGVLAHGLLVFRSEVRLCTIWEHMTEIYSHNGKWESKTEEDRYWGNNVIFNDSRSTLIAFQWVWSPIVSQYYYEPGDYAINTQGFGRYSASMPLGNTKDPNCRRLLEWGSIFMPLNDIISKLENNMVYFAYFLVHIARDRRV